MADQFVKVKPVSSYKKGMNANGLQVLPNAKKTFSCREDKYGNMMTGHTLEQCKAYSFGKIVDDNFWRTYAVSLSDAETLLNITVEQDLLKYRFLLSHYPQIVDHPEKITSNTQYIIFNEEEVAEVKNKKRQNKVKAMALLNEMSTVQKAEFLRLYKYKTDQMTDTAIMDKLCDQIEKDGGEGAVEFLAKFERADKNDRILLAKLIQFEILRPQGMAIYFGTDVISASEDLAVEFLKDPKNAKLKADWVAMYQAKKGK